MCNDVNISGISLQNIDGGVASANASTSTTTTTSPAASLHNLLVPSAPSLPLHAHSTSALSDFVSGMVNTLRICCISTFTQPYSLLITSIIYLILPGESTGDALLFNPQSSLQQQWRWWRRCWWFQHDGRPLHIYVATQHPQPPCVTCLPEDDGWGDHICYCSVYFLLFFLLFY